MFENWVVFVMSIFDRAFLERPAYLLIGSRPAILYEKNFLRAEIFSLLLFYLERIHSLKFTTAKSFQQVLVPRVFILVHSISAELSSCFPLVFPKTIVQNMFIPKSNRHSTP